MIDGIVRVAAVAPRATVAAPEKNAEALITATRRAFEDGARVVVFPALSLSTYAIGDLVAYPSLLTACEEALALYCEMTNDLDLLAFVGLPVRVGGKVYDCAAAVSHGRVIGLVPRRHVTDGAAVAPAPSVTQTITVAGCEVPFGTNLLFCCETVPGLVVAAEIGDDLRACVPPSSRHTAAGATVVACLAATPEVVGSAARRRALVEVQSARTLSAYIYADAGEGESGTGAVYSAHEMIAALGKMADESAPFGEGYASAEIDVERILFARSRDKTFVAGGDDYRRVPFTLSVEETVMRARPSRLPFVPADKGELSERCELILNIQASALAARMSRSYSKSLVLGVSGGLDSTLALLAAARAVDLRGCGRDKIIAVTMPCFGTTARTRSNAERLADAIGATLRVVDIKRAVDVHFADIGHDPNNRNVTYENAQARERTQVLMDIANEDGGLVVGTGDLSEAALGWSTYNGDHMSMYGINGGIPKTMMRHIVAYERDRLAAGGNADAADTLTDILATPVSPELLPPDGEQIAQCTEGIVGPYELHDFFLYYTVRCGFAPRKTLRYAVSAFRGEYDRETIRRWLGVFVKRFFSQQFKRSCQPDGPRVGSVSLSPRGDWSMPSDAVADAWMKDLT